jgi:hypothetical protein
MTMMKTHLIIKTLTLVLAGIQETKRKAGVRKVVNLLMREEIASPISLLKD